MSTNQFPSTAKFWKCLLPVNTVREVNETSCEFWALILDEKLNINNLERQRKFLTFELLDNVDVILYEQRAREHLITFNFQRSLPHVSQVISIKGVQERESMVHRYWIAELLPTIKIELNFSISGQKIRTRYSIQFNRGKITANLIGEKTYRNKEFFSKRKKSYLTLTLFLKVIDPSGGKSLVDNKIPFSSSIWRPTPSESFTERGFSNVTSPCTFTESINASK